MIIEGGVEPRTVFKYKAQQTNEKLDVIKDFCFPTGESTKDECTIAFTLSVDQDS